MILCVLLSSLFRRAEREGVSVMYGKTVNLGDEITIMHRRNVPRKGLFKYDIGTSYHPIQCASLGEWVRSNTRAVNRLVNNRQIIGKYSVTLITK